MINNLLKYNLNSKKLKNVLVLIIFNFRLLWSKENDFKRKLSLKRTLNFKRTLDFIKAKNINEKQVYTKL